MLFFLGQNWNDMHKKSTEEISVLFFFYFEDLHDLKSKWDKNHLHYLWMGITLAHDKSRRGFFEILYCLGSKPCWFFRFMRVETAFYWNIPPSRQPSRWFRRMKNTCRQEWNKFFSCQALLWAILPYIMHSQRGMQMVWRMDKYVELECKVWILGNWHWELECYVAANMCHMNAKMPRKEA